MCDEIDRVLVNKSEIEKMTSELGKRISKDYEGKDLLIVCVLKGAMVFASDLMRHITIPMEIDFISVSSYGDSTETSGVVKIKKDTDLGIENKHVLIVEDIVDTGITLRCLKRLFEERNAISVKICTAFDKPARRIATDLVVDYIGRTIENEYVVGYGLDYKNKMRNLPELCVLKRSVYEK